MQNMGGVFALPNLRGEWRSGSTLLHVRDIMKWRIFVDVVEFIFFVRITVISCPSVS